MSADLRQQIFTLYPYFDATLVSGQGSRVTDSTGRTYVDLAAGQLSAILGHGHPRILETARRQCERLVHVGNRFFTDAALSAAAALAETLPAGLDKVVLCSTGSEANELAVRIARAATGRHELVGIDRGYYGASHLLMSMSEFAGMLAGTGTAAPGTYRLLCPDCRHCPLGRTQPTCDVECLTVSLEMVQRQTRTVAAVLIEPILGSAGVIVPPEAFFVRLRAWCSQRGALLIADEAQTGLGRTGRWLGLDHAGVVPDILVLSKGLGAGFPVAAVVTSAEIEGRCLAAPLANMSSHSFDPFGAAIAETVLRVIDEEHLTERAAQVGETLRQRLAVLCRAHPFLANVRGRGLMIGLDVLDRDQQGTLDPMLSLALEAECLRHGVILGYSALSGALRLLPPLTLSDAELDDALVGLDAAATYLETHGIELERYLPSHPGSLQLAAGFVARFAQGQ